MRLASFFAKHSKSKHGNVSANESLNRQWESLRRSATTPSERSEIDAMFSRSMP